MKLQFRFATARPVAMYAKLCNQFLQHPHVKAIGADTGGYLLEAEGEQAELEQLADLIATAFPLSCWLTSTETKAIEQFSGDAQPLKCEPSPIAYCRHCIDTIDEDCRHCGSQADGSVDIELLAQQFLAKGKVDYHNRHGRRTLVALEQLQRHHNNLMFCQPQGLNSALYIDNAAILLLSGMEKPQLRLQPRPEFAQQNQLVRPLYNCQLADDRIAHALGNRLAQHGVTAVGVESDYDPLLIAQWHDGPVALTGDPLLKPLPVREPKHHSAHVGRYQARYHDGFAQLTKVAAEAAIDPKQAAIYALEGLQQQQRFDNKTAVLYLSREHQSGLIYKNAMGQPTWLVQLEYQDANPADLLASLAERSGTSQRLVERFRDKHGDWLAQLTGTNHRRVRGNLSGIMAMTAWLLELDHSNDAELAAEALLAQALGHEQQTSPRIDFKLKVGEPCIKVDSLPALQAAMSYRLADENCATGVAFGIIDSFADFVGNWLERFDSEFGLDGVVLAGDEFDNPILLQQIRLRLTRNFNLRLPQPLDLAGNNLALGALYHAEANG